MFLEAGNYAESSIPNPAVSELLGRRRTPRKKGGDRLGNAWEIRDVGFWGKASIYGPELDAASEIWNCLLSYLWTLEYRYNLADSMTALWGGDNSFDRFLPKIL